ncbi:regulator of (H+)-ATPase in vacuolar membrane [Pleurotus ostreatus]|uniref:Regulator of (H+)-ATPase in vacuolar membrane n=1 Tax=Pleurotus ostreatus TaxID=5322 RepID=A0A8H7A118_PLEOS|nr:regulator of (H+)-ATPase in vacuolar membrane [Pleurotus ostreatus]KAF7436647.1 regulator of (H+)-ATPase in vacuolar membrane [Pleurotus ostreatus]
MLELLQLYADRVPAEIQHLVLGDEVLILYPSADSVIMLNARTQRLVRMVAFWEVFPGQLHASDSITCISVDPAMKLLIAAMNTRIAVWSPLGSRNDTWRVHSSLTHPEAHKITTTDIRSGLLAVGCEQSLSVYTLIMENDMLKWSQKWLTPAADPSLVRFAPSLMYMATACKVDNAVRIYSTTTGRQTQTIPHPRPVTDMIWRHSQASSRDDLILYTITSDSTLRVFFPVLDAPQYLQLHASIDLYTSIPFSVACQYPHPSTSKIFWLDTEIMGKALATLLNDMPQHEEDARYRRLQDIKDEGWDLFLRILEDGSIIITAVANIDRRPPTLLRHFTLQQSPPAMLPPQISYLTLLPHPKITSQLQLIVAHPLMTFSLSPLSFFDAHAHGLKLESSASYVGEEVNESRGEIAKLVRTPEGQGVGVLRASGGGESWRLSEGGRRLSKKATWTKADYVVVLHSAKTFATYNSSESTLTLHCEPPSVLYDLPCITSLFTMPSENGGETIFAIASDSSILHIFLGSSDCPQLRLASRTILPLTLPPNMILPVDPMAWGLTPHKGKDWIKRDALLSISSCGELAFWVTDVVTDTEDETWKCTGKVRTGRSNIRTARCSSAKKSALVVPTSEGGEELTIWDSHESEFASGLEYSGHFTTPVNDLDWSSTPDAQSILAVGFLDHVDIYYQQRMTYFDDAPGWAICHRIDLSGMTPYPISDSIWLSNGSLLVATGRHMLLYSQPKPEVTSESLFEYVARNNGPLVDHHPQMVLQCLLWGKVDIVKDIIVNLAKDIASINSKTKQIGDGWTTLTVERFLEKDENASTRSVTQRKPGYSFLFNEAVEKHEDPNEEGFSRPLVLQLLESLENNPLPHLTANENAHLLVLIQVTLEVDEQKRALDANGLRYLTTMRSFYILNRRASEPNSPASDKASGISRRRMRRRERLRFRDMIWAFHSESQDLLLNASTAACNGKMCWSDARALGIALWLNSIDTLKAQVETIGRNEYMAGDNRDPTACSLFYFALGKVKLVHGLWRQAAWHKEQAVMLKFLSNDFSEPRWRTAALKNAYALLGKQRFDYAAAFFLLGGCLKDAVSVCLKQLDDFQLAIALARIGEQSNDGPILLSILNNTVLPIAFEKGNRWLASWAFWLLHRRDLAVRILVTPLEDIISSLDIQVTEIGEPHYDDTSLALLFSQLRSKTLQAAQGTSEISSRSEFNFVLQIARVFCRMGCHVLGLDLVRSWSFERPSTIIREAPMSSMRDEERASRHSMFALEPAMRRRSSIIIDMDIPSLPPTRSASPSRRAPSMEPTIPEEPIPIKDEGDFLARKAGLGSLMKSAKHDVQVPEFDMGAFF